MLILRWLQMLGYRAGQVARAHRVARRLCLLPLLMLAPLAQALDFRYTNPFPDGPLAGVARGLTISGDLVPGDTDKLIDLIRRKPADAWFALGRVELEISGGDPGEALRLADTLAELYPHMVASSDCAGACAITWLSGAWRMLPEGRIGLQKPLAAQQASDVQADRLRNYLFKQGLPPPSYERWQAARNNSVYWLTGPEINSTGTWPPYYFEKLTARCPKLDASDESFHALRRCAARLVISQKAFAFDKLLAGVNDPWWNENKDVFLSAPR
ncbi:MAG: hypothetical protein Q8K71_09030 [Polaromonas sp.]|nr:hypothetical protein [Polaromonas sp.]MDP3752299.1 hypothetical protein [Polaromonas sp.]